MSLKESIIHEPLPMYMILQACPETSHYGDVEGCSASSAYFKRSDPTNSSRYFIQWAPVTNGLTIDLKSYGTLDTDLPHDRNSHCLIFV